MQWKLGRSQDETTLDVGNAAQPRLRRRLVASKLPLTAASGVIDVWEQAPVTTASSEAMKLPHIPPRIRVLLQLGGSIALLVFLISRLDWPRTVELVRGAHPLLLAAVVLIQTADRVLMALKWHQLLRVLDQRFGRWSAIRVYYESTFIGFALPLGGLGPDIVRFARLRSQGINPHVTLTSMVVERLNGVVATLALFVAGLVVLAWLAPQAPLRHFALVSAFVAAVAGTLAAVSILHPAPGRALFKMLKWLKLSAWIASARFAKYLEAARAYAARRPTLVLNLGLSMIEQTAAVFTLWAASYALGTPVPWLVCLAVAPVAVLFQRLPLTYGGLGLREGSAAALLVALGYDYSAALLMLMTQFVMFLISLLPGAIILAMSGRPRLEPPAQVMLENDLTLNAERPLPRE